MNESGFIIETKTNTKIKNYIKYLEDIIKRAESDLKLPTYKFDFNLYGKYHRYLQYSREVLQRGEADLKEIEKVVCKLHDLREAYLSSNLLRVDLEVIADKSTYVSAKDSNINFAESEVLFVNGVNEERKEIFLNFAIDKFFGLKDKKMLTVKLGLRNNHVEKPQNLSLQCLMENVDCSSLTYNNSRNLEVMDETYEFDVFALQSPPFYCNINRSPWVFADISELYKNLLYDKSNVVFKIYSNVNTEVCFCGISKEDKYDAPHMDELVQAKYKPRIFVSYEENAAYRLSSEIENAKNILNNTPSGDGIWQFSKKNRKILQEAINFAVKLMDSEKNEEILIREIRNIKTCVEIYKKKINVPKVERPSLLYTKADLPHIRTRVDRTPELKKKYDEIKALVDQYDIEKMEDDFKQPRWGDFLNLNNRAPFVFDAPMEAKTAYVEVIIKGTADVVVDSAEFSELIGDRLEFDNGSFEKGDEWPSDWQLSSNRETTFFHWENTDIKGERAHNGKRAVRVINKSKKDIAALKYLVPFQVKPGVRYKFNCRLSYSEPFSDAAYLQVTFLDERGNIIEVVTSHPENNPYENRPTEVRIQVMNAATVYMIDGKKHYAVLAKRLLNLMIDSLLNILKKIETGFYWTFFQTIGVQVIHTSQFFIQCAIAYDVISDAGIYTSNEDSEIREKMYTAMDYLKNGLSFSAVHHNNKGNMNCSRAAALAIGAFVFKDDYRAGEYYEYGMTQMKYVFENNFRYDSDGSWKETEGYNWAVMETIFILGMVMQRDCDLNHEKEDLFLYKDILKKNMEFLTSIAGPPDRYNTKYEGASLFPGVGDSGWNNTNYFYYLAYAYKNIDPVLASRLMLSWGRMKNEITQSDYPILNYVYIDYDIPTECAVLEDFVKSEKFDGRGMCIFRQNVGKNDEDYILMTYTNRKDGHGHSDVGGLNIYLDGIPVCIDPGVDGYSSGSWAYYKSAVAHSLVTFNDVTSDTGKIADENFFTSDAFDYAILDVDDVENVKKEYRRHLAFVKNGFDIIVIWDDIKVEQDISSVFRLATLTDGHSISVSEDRVVGDLLADAKKQVEVVTLYPGARFSIRKDKNPQAGFPRNEEFSFQNYIEMENSKEKPGFLTMINLKDKNQNGVGIEKILLEFEALSAYKIEKNNKYFYLIINDANECKNIVLQVEEDIVDLQTNEVFVGGKICIPPNKMMFLTGI